MDVGGSVPSDWPPGKGVRILFSFGMFQFEAVIAIVASFEWRAEKALDKSRHVSYRAVAMRSCALKLGWMLGKRRSEIFEMARRATSIDPEKILNEAEVEILTTWMFAIRESIREGSFSQCEEQLIGQISHYYPRVSVGVIELTEGNLKLGNVIHVRGAVTDFKQTVDSMQIEHQGVAEALKGLTVAVKVAEKVREHDGVFRL